MSFWDKTKIDLLKKYWAEGLSASAIAKKLGDGATRNSVIGKKSRLGLGARAISKRSDTNTNNIKESGTPENKTQKLSKKAKFRALLLDKNFPPENPIYDVSKLTDEHCRYPSNHPGNKDFYFCGRKPFDGQVYCRLHLMLCFTPKNPKEEDQITEEDIPKFIEKKIKSA